MDAGTDPADGPRVGGELAATPMRVSLVPLLGLGTGPTDADVDGSIGWSRGIARRARWRSSPASAVRYAAGLFDGTFVASGSGSRLSGHCRVPPQCRREGGPMPLWNGWCSQPGPRSPTGC